MDGSHLADLLLSKGYEVYGLERHKAVPNRTNVAHIENKINFVKGDLADLGSLISVISQVRPDEIYNFASQSFVVDSWIVPEMSCDITAIGVLRLLEAVRMVDKKIRFLQASSSEMFGTNGNVANEKTPFHPRSPYAVSKVFGHLITQNYREAHGIFACSSMSFNHESERRGFEFVTRKITDGVAKIYQGTQSSIKLGNVYSKRDWGYAPDYVDAMYRMLQQETPDDFVLSTGVVHSVEDFLTEAFSQIGINDWKPYVEIDQTNMRVSEVPYLQGDSRKAKEILSWEPLVMFKELVHRMVKNDIERVSRSWS